MNNPKISLIASIGKNRELGKENKLLFQIPEDMKLFKEKTIGHVVIMGRKTYESIGRPLPNRTNIIVTRDSSPYLKSHPELVSGSDSGSRIESGMTGGFVVSSIEEAMELAKTIEEREIFIIGGAQIYELALPFADKLYLTVVNKTVGDADAFFPDYSEFTKVLFERPSRDKNYSYTFLDLTKE